MPKDTSDEQKVIERLKFDRETPGTYVFVNTDKTAAVPTLYVKKSAFDGEPPNKIKIIVKGV